MNKWQKCKDPEEWFCDICYKCGGCNTCSPRKMYHRGEDYSLCEECYKETIVNEAKKNKEENK